MRAHVRARDTEMDRWQGEARRVQSESRDRQTDSAGFLLTSSVGTNHSVAQTSMLLERAYLPIAVPEDQIPRGASFVDGLPFFPKNEPASFLEAFGVHHPFTLASFMNVVPPLLCRCTKKTGTCPGVLLPHSPNLVADGGAAIALFPTSLV